MTRTSLAALILALAAAACSASGDADDGVVDLPQAGAGGATAVGAEDLDRPQRLQSCCPVTGLGGGDDVLGR